MMIYYEDFYLESNIFLNFSLMINVQNFPSFLNHFDYDDDFPLEIIDLNKLMISANHSQPYLMMMESDGDILKEQQNRTQLMMVNKSEQNTHTFHLQLMIFNRYICRNEFH